MMRRLLMLSLILLPFAVAIAEPLPPPKPRPAAAQLYIISPSDGAIVESPVTVRFGLAGMGVAPAGVALPDTGHHHLLVDLDTLPPLDQPLPNNEHLLHFGGGQTETTLDLPPGKHRLQLILGDELHRPHQPPLISAPVMIEVR